MGKINLPEVDVETFVRRASKLRTFEVLGVGTVLLSTGGVLGLDARVCCDAVFLTERATERVRLACGIYLL